MTLFDDAIGVVISFFSPISFAYAIAFIVFTILLSRILTLKKTTMTLFFSWRLTHAIKFIMQCYIVFRSWFLSWFSCSKLLRGGDILEMLT